MISIQPRSPAWCSRSRTASCRSTSARGIIARLGPLALLLCAALHASAAEPRVLGADGPLPAGALALADGRLAAGGATLAIDQLVAARFAALPAEDVDQGVVLRNGDALAGTVVSLQADKLALQSDLLGALTIPVAEVQAIHFAPRRLADDGGATAAGLVLTNGDRLTGTIKWINEQTIGLDNGRKVLQIARDRVALVGLVAAMPVAPATAATAAGEARQFARLANGDRLSGRLRSLDGAGCVLETVHAGAVTIPRALLAVLWSEGGALLPLSRLQPGTVRQVPQFDEDFPHRIDRGLGGGFLDIAGQRYERGLGCHARCELTYVLDGGFAALVAEVGIDGAVGRHGEVVFRVLVDGKPAWDSGALRGGDAAKPLRVPLTGARSLTLVSDPGAGGLTVGDRATWGWPVLVRAGAPK